jgi:hypothetical protein
MDGVFASISTEATSSKTANKPVYDNLS